MQDLNLRSLPCMYAAEVISALNQLNTDPPSHDCRGALQARQSDVVLVNRPGIPGDSRLWEHGPSLSADSPERDRAGLMGQTSQSVRPGLDTPSW